MAKRAFDIIFSLVGLLFLCPVLLIISAAVVIADGRPVLFTQARVGRDGRVFRLYKFRTMANGNHGPLLTTDNDARITPLGRRLRQCKLDELPQLINIFVGDMSFVGPRPEVPKYVDLFKEEYKQILVVRPGITDPASLIYRNESALLQQGNAEKIYIEQILPHKLEQNLAYVKQHSLVGDIRLIIRTMSALLGKS